MLVAWRVWTLRGRVIECRVGTGVGHVANNSQMDRLVIWIPATWKFMGRALDVQGCGIKGLRICHKAPVGRAS